MKFLARVETQTEFANGCWLGIHTGFADDGDALESYAQLLHIARIGTSDGHL